MTNWQLAVYSTSIFRFSRRSSRSLLVFAFLALALRMAGKREIGQLNVLDMVVLLLVSDALQNAMIGNDNTLIGGVIGASALLVVGEAALVNDSRAAEWAPGDHGAERAWHLGAPAALALGVNETTAAARAALVLDPGIGPEGVAAEPVAHLRDRPRREVLGIA